MPPTCPASLGHSRAKSGRDLAEPQDVCLECLCFRVLAAMGEVLTEWGGRRCPPPGVFNPPATNGVPTACRTQFQLALNNLSWPISTFFRAVRSEVFFPLSFPFPRSLGTTANLTPKSGKVWFFRTFFDVFSMSFFKRNSEGPKIDPRGRTRHRKRTLKAGLR